MLLTFGHGAASAEQMIGLLQGAGISLLVDVRTAPGSRRHPHVARAELQRLEAIRGLSKRTTLPPPGKSFTTCERSRRSRGRHQEPPMTDEDSKRAREGARRRLIAVDVLAAGVGLQA